MTTKNETVLLANRKVRELRIALENERELSGALRAEVKGVHVAREGESANVDANVMRSALRAIGFLVAEFGDDGPASIVPSAQVAMTQRSALRTIGLLVSELSR